MSGMVAIGKYSTACVCAPNHPSERSTSAIISGALGGAVAAVQTMNQQNENHQNQRQFGGSNYFPLQK